MPAASPSSVVMNSSITGAEIMARDWSASSLGSRETWPAALQSTLALMLACPTPMFLAWGPDLLCFYNDAYRPILGFRLDTALGQPFRTVWASIWNEIEPLVTATLAGETCTMTDMALDLSRNGVAEESWWTFTYSPAFDDDGRIAGLFCVTGETTARIVADLALKTTKAERDFVIDLTARQRALVDPEAIVQLSAAELARRLDVHRVGFYRLVGTAELRHGSSWTDGTLAPLTGVDPVSRFGARAERLRRRGRTLAFSDSRRDLAGDLVPFAERGVLAGVCVPLMNQGRWQAGIYLHHAEVRHWTPAEIALAKEVAELTWLALERAEALLRLNQRVDRQSVALAEASTEIKAETGRRAAAESQVRQLQKMEAVGQLTGGIAHDFNNMLAIIIGGLNLAQRRLDRGETDVRPYLDGAMDGAMRAATLTQRLLAFSRQQPLAPEAVDANRLVSSLAELLTRSLGERVQLETMLDTGLWKARADPNQLENVIVNLAVNARDAMPDGGKLTVETANTHVDEDYARDADMASGQYVMIAVTDTGTGMPPEIMAKVFDPFFTTKGVGKGTGLGLSQVFGFVRQSGGHVRVYSEVGHGTTFKLYLPRFWGEETPAAPRSTGPVRGGQPTEIVLVVEDEERVRTYSVEALRDLNYTVLHAASGSEALAMIEGGQDVTLLFTDVVMPEMTGRQLADRATALLPGLRILYTTGYTRDAVVHNGVIDPGTNFLPKPFNIDRLACKVRDVLDG